MEQYSCIILVLGFLFVLLHYTILSHNKMERSDEELNLRRWHLNSDILPLSYEGKSVETFSEKLAQSHSKTFWWFVEASPGCGGKRLIGISRSLIGSNILIELIFNTCGEFRWSPEGPLSQIHSPHLHAWAPWNLIGCESDKLVVCGKQREVSAFILPKKNCKHEQGSF